LDLAVRSLRRGKTDRLVPLLGSTREALDRLAAFHYRFVRLHPLPSANQSLSMSFVNAALRRSFGVGTPHLLLDQLALRFEPSAYQRLFARAVGAWCTPWPNPSERLRQLTNRTKMLNELVSAVSNAASLIEARALLPSMSYAAELALLSDAPRPGDGSVRIG